MYRHARGTRGGMVTDRVTTAIARGRGVCQRHSLGNRDTRFLSLPELPDR
jgi:hypothetical protein